MSSLTRFLVRYRLTKAEGEPLSTWAGCGLAVLLTALATSFRVLLGPMLGADLSPFPYYFGVIICVAWLGGWKPATLAIGLNLLAAHGVFFASARMLALPSRTEVVSSLGFASISALIVVAMVRMHAANRVAREARDRALAAARAKDDFLAALSHELRTPLNPVLLLASDETRLAELSADERADWQIVRQNVELEAQLIDDLLDVTAIASAKLKLQPVPTPLHESLESALDIVAADVREKRLTLRRELAAADLTVLADPVRLQQVWWNLLKNAVKFTPAGGTITIRSRAAANHCVTVEVIDTGIGLLPEEREMIFEAFVQGRQGDVSTPSRGLGLGLAISRQLVHRQGGRIHATSAGPGRGATFTVELPLVASAPRVAAGRRGVLEEAERNRETGASPLLSLRILVVEDHATTRTILEKLLVQRGHAVDAAGSLGSARELVGANVYDLVLSDLGLPDGNGYELLREVAATRPTRGIALSGYGAAEDLAASRAAGFSAHLVKPITLAALDTALRDAMRE